LSPSEASAFSSWVVICTAEDVIDAFPERIARS